MDSVNIRCTTNNNFAWYKEIVASMVLTLSEIGITFEHYNNVPKCQMGNILSLYEIV